MERIIKTDTKEKETKTGEQSHLTAYNLLIISVNHQLVYNIELQKGEIFISWKIKKAFISIKYLLFKDACMTLLWVSSPSKASTGTSLGHLI